MLQISQEVAVALAESEYEKYRVIRDCMLKSDFDHEMKKLLNNEPQKLNSRHAPLQEIDHIKLTEA